MKKILSVLLTAALVGSLSAPALAVDPADARLTAVTQVVKTTLDLDTEGYDQFYGDCSENELAATWSLDWSSDTGYLSITATDEGKILSYHRSEDSSASSGSLELPAVSRTQAAETAQRFLDKVLDPALESVTVDPEGQDSLGVTRYYFRGEILLNGLPSPLGYGIGVDAASNEVVNFYRDDLAGTYFGEVPAAVPATAQAEAAAALAGELSLRLEYVLAEDGTTAVLRYLADPIDEFYVDGHSGELVNLSQLERELWTADSGSSGDAASDMNMAEAAPEASMRKQLTDAELQGVAKLEGVLDKEALDQKARTISQLGLDRYSLAQCEYSVERQDKDDQEEAKVTASLTYARKEGDRVARRYVSVDAKTGELISVRSSLPYITDYKAQVDQAAAQKKAEAFLEQYYQDQFAHAASYEAPQRASWWRTADENPSQWSMTYARQENGYFYPANSLDIAIDSSDGSVSRFSWTWDEDVTFDDPQGIISKEKALEIYAGTFDTTLGYIAVPQKLDLAGPQLRPMLDTMGMSYFYTLKLGYGLESNLDHWFQGIDAKTGQVVEPAVAETQRLGYSDLEGHWVKAAAEALADYNVGWAVDKMEPDRALTQLDLVTLLAATSWYGPMDPGALTEEEINDLYRQAYRMGMLAVEERDPERVVTRLEIVKMLLDQGGYSRVARLEGIYRVDFSDAEAIAASDLGYAALAQGMGIVSGDSQGAFAGGRSATRAEAVEMLYRFLGRDQ